MPKKKLALLGCSGSIGRSALDVIRSFPDSFEPVLLSCHRNATFLEELGKEYPGASRVLTGSEGGRKALREALGGCGADMALNGIAGAAGLEPSLWALDSGMDLALANKESIVMAGGELFARAEGAGKRIIPVDSEHSAIFSLLEAHGRENCAGLILTASGGPFREKSYEELAQVSPEDALRHPTWNMGAKITIDSASMANKGLEVIEAFYLFKASPEDISVVIHPQSVVHSMIRTRDGSIYADMSRPDMRLPIHNALFYPELQPCPFAQLDFSGLTLSFERPDPRKFPLLPLAYETTKKGAPYPALYNAANEVGVNFFLQGLLPFLDIPRIVEYVLEDDWSSPKALEGEGALEGILEADQRGRERAASWIERWGKGI